ncbi:MAG: peptide chain release factor 2 [Gammaproteobacteria bacterium]|nr:peptide chain release factor 2 [Chromatiales bacterium]MDP6675352.1 peptide chain release factor 2 [Gammaproteobacteria bacterium]
METNQIKAKIADLQQRSIALRGYLDFDEKVNRLAEVSKELENPEVWNNPALAEALGKERSGLEAVTENIERVTNVLAESAELLELAEAEDDESTLAEVQADVSGVEVEIEKLEFQRMFSGKADASNAFVDVQAGSGGTEAQDWAEMLLRMYLKWAETNGFSAELIEMSPGEVAGIKSATIHVVGEYAFGWLRTELGVHRLVRKSPFDSGNRRHTSFAAIFVSPEIDDNFEIEINPADLRIDVYRASGAGGQHVNRTESAVRITHLPTNSVVQCQNDRSQHKNKATAMKQLRAKLYELEEQKRRTEAQQVEETKSDIGWGSQIRSYVLDQSRIKDLRTGVETGNTEAVLNGGLNRFIEESLKQGL